jgi:hypothetical protein
MSIFKKSDIEFHAVANLAVKGDFIIQGVTLLRASFNSTYAPAYHLYFYIGDNIVVSTNRELDTPRPSTLFLEKYAEEYNKGKQIKEVLIEFDSMRSADSFDLEVYSGKIKINPKDNTVTIKRVKDSWDKAEFKIELKNAMRIYAFCGVSDRPYSEEEFEKEFEEWFNKTY